MYRFEKGNPSFHESLETSGTVFFFDEMRPKGRVPSFRIFKYFKMLTLVRTVLNIYIYIYTYKQTHIKYTYNTRKTNGE